MATTEELSHHVGALGACRAMEVSRAALYRLRTPRSEGQRPQAARRSPARALSPLEHKRVLGLLHSERFVDRAPPQVYATLLDEGTYLCSVSTMYRILEAAGEVKERRNQLRHPLHPKPILRATGPNHVWSWDITKLLGPRKWTYYYLYVVLDIYSRYVVAWTVSPTESGALAKELFGEATERQGVLPDELTVHSDRGSAMTSKTMCQKLADLGVTKSLSRPRVSNDNPYSESQFKTLKHTPSFPGRFGSIEDARAFCRMFFCWYNEEHRHSGIGYLSPGTVHRGQAQRVHDARSTVLAAAYERHPERFVNKKPSPPSRPSDAWINEPVQAIEVGELRSKERSGVALAAGQPEEFNPSTASQPGAPGGQSKGARPRAASLPLTTGRTGRSGCDGTDPEQGGPPVRPDNRH